MASGTYGDEDFVLLGLTHENVARLFADEPIVVRTSRPPPSGIALSGGPVIVIVAGATEDAILASMKAAGLSASAIHDDRGTPT
jgi:hypothetical protein